MKNVGMNGWMKEERSEQPAHAFSSLSDVCLSVCQPVRWNESGTAVTSVPVGLLVDRSLLQSSLAEFMAPKGSPPDTPLHPLGPETTADISSKLSDRKTKCSRMPLPLRSDAQFPSERCSGRHSRQLFMFGRQVLYGVDRPAFHPKAVICLS